MVGEERTPSAAFQNLSNMLDPFLGSPRSPEPVPSDPPARPPPQRPISVSHQMQPGSPIAQEFTPPIDEEVPVQAWAVYSPISEPERSADMWNEPTLMMSRRSRVGENAPHDSDYALRTRIAALSQAVEHAESQVAFLQQSEAEQSSTIFNLRRDFEICNTKLAAAERALDDSAQGEDEVSRLYAEQQRVRCSLANMLSLLIEAKLEVKKVVSNEKMLQTRYAHLELEVASVRSQMRDSFVGYDKQHDEMDAELAEATRVKAQLEAAVAELTAEINELKLHNIQLQNLATNSVALRQSDHENPGEILHRNIEVVQHQNDLLKKEAAEALQRNADLAGEVDRLMLIEKELATLQRNHDDLHKVHSDSQQALERMRLKQERDHESRAIAVSLTPEVAHHGQTSVSTILSTTLNSLHEDAPREYLLGMHIVSKGNTMMVKSFARGSVCSKALRAGNHLISIDGRRIKDAAHLRQICRGVPGTILSIKFKQAVSDEVFELQLLRGVNAQGDPVLTEHIPCTPRGPPPAADMAAPSDMDVKLGALERKWERQLEEVLQAKAECKRQHGEAIKQQHAAELEAERALALLAQVQSDFAKAKEGEAQILKVYMCSEISRSSIY